MQYETVRCSVCKLNEGIVIDYRIKPEFAFGVNYKTPLGCYDQYSVCAKCFTLPDKSFRAKIASKG